MKKLIFCIYFSVILLIISNVLAQVKFIDVAERAGIRDLNFPYLIFGDYDNDGYADMIACPLSPLVRKLFHNEGDGTFQDVTDMVGAHGAGPNGAIFLDFDNDGYLDIFMSGNNTNVLPVYAHGDRLLRNNGDGTFTDVSKISGLSPEVRSQPMQPMDSFAFDYDNDGFLDIFVSNTFTTPITPNYLYHNEGNGHFKDIAKQIALDDPKIGGISPGDYDNDGDLDIYISVMGSAFFEPDPNDQGIDKFYRNEGNGIFVDVAEEVGIRRHANHQSGNFFDYNNDGYLDLFLNNVDYGDVYGFSVLYKNNGDGTFSDVTRQAHILPMEYGILGMDYGDYDNDGWLDLCVTPIGGVGIQPVLIYHNERDGTFREVSRSLEIGSEAGAQGVFVDYDNDGNLDIFMAARDRTRLYQNVGTSNKWLQIKLVGRLSNRDAIGARIKVVSGELSMIREIMSGAFLYNPDRLPAHFGLGLNQKVDLVEVRWPSGIVQTFTDIPADQRITIDEIEGIITVIRKVIPDSGHPDGGTAVRIYGESFQTGSKVLFGGAEAKNTRFETPTLITTIVPPGVGGFVDVEIINPDGSIRVLRNGFRYSTIQVTKITPETGPTAGGIQIQIEGYGFQQGINVKIGDSILQNLFFTPILLKGTLPAGASGPADISLINPDGEMIILKKAFTYVPPPKIDQVYPDISPLTLTSTIRIIGSGFIKVPYVQIGGVSALKVTYISSESLEVGIFNNSVGPQDILVVNPDGQRFILPGGLTIVAPPKIKSISPSTGSLEGGTKITIIGEPSFDNFGQIYNTDLSLVGKVFIGEMECSEVKVESQYVVTAITPANIPGQKDVIIYDITGQSDKLENAFTYNTAPQITKVIPDNGKLAGGTKITIEGNGFMPGAVVVLKTKDGYSVLTSPVEFISSTTITTITPFMDPGVCDIMVRNPDGQFMIFPDGFTYNPIPTITGITPNYGSSSGGTKIAIEGTGFLPGVKLMIGEKYATTQFRDSETIEAITPPNEQGVWNVRVINTDTQEALKSGGFITVGELAYNYPNPFRASQGTVFRYVTNETPQSITVKIFNIAGIPVDILYQENTNEVRWQNSHIHEGMYIYYMEVNLINGESKHFKKVLEVYK